MKEILYATRGVSTIEYEPRVPCLIDTITEFLYSDEFREHLNNGLKLLIEKQRIHGAIGWLANTKYLGAIPEDDTKWVIEDWMVRAAQAGIRYVATVLPDDEVMRVGNDFFDGDFVVPNTNGLILKHFHNLESACEWLQGSLIKS
jgi:hypothetical protein